MKKLVFAVLTGLVAMSVATCEAASRTYTVFSGGSTYSAGHIQFHYTSGSQSNGSAPVVDTEFENVAGADYDTEIKFGSNSQKVSNSNSAASPRYVGFYVALDPSLTNINDWVISHFYGFQTQASTGTGSIVFTLTPYTNYNSAGSGLAAYTNPIAFTDVNGSSYFNDFQTSGFYMVASWYNSTGNKTLYDFTIGFGTSLVTNSVPEPSTMAVFGGIALLGLVAVRRNRKS